MKRMILPVLALFVLAGIAVAADSPKSGLGVGDAVAPFNVKDITGPKKGTTLCYRCQYGAKPVACVFTREITDEVVALIQQIDATVGENKDKNMCSFVVYLTEDADAGAKQLAKLAEDKKIKNIPLTVFDNTAGPEDYKINKKAGVTVFYWNKSRVQSSHAFAPGKMTKDDVKAVAADAATILK